IMTVMKMLNYIDSIDMRDAHFPILVYQDAHFPLKYKRKMEGTSKAQLGETKGAKYNRMTSIMYDGEAERLKNKKGTPLLEGVEHVLVKATMFGGNKEDQKRKTLEDINA
ncbi:hypothetical protein ACJX0J_013568, partial [Zea mays]